jgi:hypothetical protein
MELPNHRFEKVTVLNQGVPQDRLEKVKFRFRDYLRSEKVTV